MKCYVLHPDSEDMMLVQDGRSRKLHVRTDWNAGPVAGDVSDAAGVGDTEWKSINYIFKKKFHVSPFMGMVRADQKERMHNLQTILRSTKQTNKQTNHSPTR